MSRKNKNVSITIRFTEEEAKWIRKQAGRGSRTPIIRACVQAAMKKELCNS